MTQTNTWAGEAPSKLFRGYDSVAAGMLNQSAVTGRFDPSDNARSGVNIEVCESIKDLAEALEIEGSLSVGYLKAANVTAKMKFMQKLDVTARSVTIVVYANHEDGTWVAKNVGLAEGVVAPKNSNELAEFVDKYGDSYVSAVTQGGEYYAVYTFRTETREEQQSLATSLRAKGIGGGVKVEAEVQGELSKILKETSTSWTFHQEITGHANPILPSQDKLIEFAIAFPSKKLTSPVTTGFNVSGYEGVGSITKADFRTIIDNRNHFLGDRGVLPSLARLTLLRNQIKWLKQIYDRYNYDGDANLLAFEKEVQADLAKVEKQIAGWKDNAAGKFEQPQLPSLDKGEPVLNYASGKSPAFGGEGGGPFDFMSVGEALRNRVKIASIRLAEVGARVRRIEIGYASDKKNWTAVEGGRDGAGKEILYLREDQFPVRFEVRHGASLDRLAVHLDDGQYTWAGGNGGVAVDWKVPAGSVVLGLSGRSGQVIDQLRIIYATLKPALFKMPI